MASSTPLCDICNLRHTSNPATVWCSECDEGFCTDCYEHHHLAKSTRHHITIPIDNYQKLPEYVLNIEQSCKTHEEKCTHFCKHHDSPCCVTCILQNHKQCKDISKIVDVVKNVKSSYTFQDTEQNITELAQNIKKIQKDQRENLISLQNSKIQVEKEIKEFRVKVNNHLDKLQDDIIKELNEAEENEKKKIQNMVDDLAQKEKDINQLQVNLSNIKQHASDLQAYLAMKKIQIDVSKTETSVVSLVNNNTKLKVLSIKMNDTMKDFLSSAKTFGNIIIEDKGCTVVPSKKKNPQAQLLVPHQHRNIYDISLQLQQTLKVDGRIITGCCTLPNGRLVFTSYRNDELIFMNADGTLITTLIIPDAFDVKYVKYNNSLAVTSVGNENMCIRFINIKTYKVEQTIELETRSFGIVEKNNTLFYCGDESLYSLSLMDKSITKVEKFKLLSSRYIDIFDNNLYHTNTYTNTVTCSDLSGEVKWEFEDENVLKSAGGISVDNQGNVYVAGDETGNVVVISPDGQKCRELLSNKDKLNEPVAIHYDRSTDNLLVANNMDNQAFLYKVT